MEKVVEMPIPEAGNMRVNTRVQGEINKSKQEMELKVEKRKIRRNTD